jgi:GNAT superfamily N-acetyltransferase
LPDLPAGLTIRRALPADHAACAGVFLAAYRQAFPTHPDDYYVPARYYESIGGEEQWVAVSGGKIVAVLSIYWPENFVHSLYVLPAEQGCGIGAALLDAVCREARGNCELKCDQANRRAIAFYRRRGWREVGEGMAETGPWLRLRR